VIGDARRVCELLLGLPNVILLGVEDRPGPGLWQCTWSRRGQARLPGCGSRSVVKDRETVELVDLPAFVNRRLFWRKVPRSCPNGGCPITTWMWAHPRLAGAGLAMTDRAGRWVTGVDREEVTSDEALAWRRAIRPSSARPPWGGINIGGASG
jgi:hypothetical protein